MVSRRTRKREVSAESFCRLVIVAGSGTGVASWSRFTTASLKKLQEVYPYRTHLAAASAADTCDYTPHRAESQVFVLISILEPLTTAFAEIESTGYFAEFHEQAVVPFP